MAPIATAVRDRLLRQHRDTLESALAPADAVEAAWNGDSTRDRREVVEPYRARLRGADAIAPLLDAATSAVRAAGYDLAAAPVPARPYVAVAARGVLLRLPLAAGGRLVVELRAFTVDPYRRGPDLPGALRVTRRGTG